MKLQYIGTYLKKILEEVKPINPKIPHFTNYSHITLFGKKIVSITS